MNTMKITFNEIFKTGFLANFTNNVATTTIIITLGYAFIISIYVYMIYKLTSRGIIYSKKFNSTMALMSIVTAAVVLSMQANIVVSLGMVGALSIVRFRTAVKEPRDLLFLFWSISNGIVIGAQVYEIALILTVVLSFAMLFFDLIPEKRLPYLLVLNLNNKKQSLVGINKVLSENKIKYRVRSTNITTDNINIVYEFSVKKYNDLITKISALSYVKDVNLLTQDGEIQY